MPVRYSVAFDAADPDALARWWAETLGWELSYSDGEIGIIRPAGVVEGEGDDEHMIFFRVPEAKVAKNRCHVDLHPGGEVTPFVDALVARGARRLSEQGEGWPVDWTVLADPEGNELCVVHPRPG